MAPHFPTSESVLAKVTAECAIQIFLAIMHKRWVSCEKVRDRNILRDACASRTVHADKQLATVSAKDGRSAVIRLADVLNTSKQDIQTIGTHFLHTEPSQHILPLHTITTDWYTTQQKNFYEYSNIASPLSGTLSETNWPIRHSDDDLIGQSQNLSKPLPWQGTCNGQYCKGGTLAACNIWYKLLDHLGNS